MEYCDRGSLAGSVGRGIFVPSCRWGRTPALRALVRTSKEIAQGLAYLHSLGITHGDLKPANVLLKSSRVDRRGFTCRLADFGFSRLNGQGPGVPATLAYTAPEAVEGLITPASDVWSFGIMLYEMATGEHPFADMRWGSLLGLLLSGDVQLMWPEAMHPVLRRLGIACTMLDATIRPTSRVVNKVLVKLEESMKSSQQGCNIVTTMNSSVLSGWSASHSRAMSGSLSTMLPTGGRPLSSAPSAPPTGSLSQVPEGTGVTGCGEGEPGTMSSRVEALFTNQTLHFGSNTK
jgi:serine/threonine protein kinase